MRYLLALLITHSLFASAPTTLSIDPAASSYNSVNVTTGHYFEASADLIVRGAEPIVLYRSHVSCDYAHYRYGNWRFHDERLYTNIERHGRDHRITLVEASGGVVPFKPEVECGYHHKDCASWDASAICEESYCNTSSGELSGKAHIQNYRLHFDRLRYQFTLTTGSGERRIYGHQGKRHHFRRARKGRNEDSIGEEFGLLEIIRPSGNRIRYTYDEHNRVTEIRATDSSQFHTLAWVHFEYAHPKYREISRITASDGQQIDYHYADRTNRASKTQFRWSYHLLDKITYNNHREETYSHHKDRITYHYGPSGEYLATDYIKESDRYYGDNHPDCFRVARQYRPLSPNGEPITIAQFDYHPGRGEEPEWTDVTDAEGNLTRYHYSTHKRIHLIERFQGKDQLIGHEIFHRDGPNLIGHYKTDANHIAYYARELTYDERGNVTSETLLGNLTGSGSPIAVDPIYSWDRRQSAKRWRRIPTGPRRIGTPDTHTTIFSYSTDGYNNLLTESSDDLHTVYTYSSRSHLLESKKTYASSILISTDTYTYNLAGQQTQHTHTDGHHTLITDTTYNTCHLPETITESTPDGPIKTTRHTYSPRNLITTTEVYDSENNLAYTLHYIYDPVGNLLTKTDPLGQTTYTYNPSGNLLTTQTPTTLTTISYDLAGRPTQTTQSDAHYTLTTHTTYNALNNPTSSTDPFSNTTHTTQTPTTLTTTDPLGNPTTTTYDPAGNPTSVTDPLGNPTTTTYNSRNQPLTITRPDDTTETFTYCPNGLLHTHTNIATTTYTYDALSRPLTVITGDKQTTYTYQGEHLASTTHPDGTTTTYTYNSQGQLISEDHEGTLTTYAYDTLGRQNSVTTHSTITTTYDALSRPILIETPTTTTAYTYDYDSNITSVTEGDDTTTTTHSLLGPISTTDPLHNQTTTIHTLTPHTTTTTDPLGHKTHTTYDALSRPETIQQPGLLTTYTYDPLGNPLTITYNDYTLSYTYDSASRPLTLTENQTRATTHTYDSHGRLSTTTKPSGITHTYTYDDHARLHTHSGPDFSDTYTYDSMDRLLTVTSQTGTTTRTYNSRGHLTSETLENGLTLTYHPDPYGRPTHLTLPDDSTIDYTYIGSQISSLSRNNYTFTYTYNSRGLLTHIQSPIESTTRTYTPTGALHTLTSPSLTQTLSYDPLQNLTTLHHTDAHSTFTTTYTYDALSQLASENQTPYPHTPLGNLYPTDAHNQLLSTPYDLDGQPTDHTFDSRGRLTNSDSTTYTYDPFHRRLTKNNQRFLYQGDDLIATYTDTLQTLRPLGPSLGAEIGAAPLLELQNSTYFPLYDHRGSTTILLNSWGLLSEITHYTAFGTATTYNGWGFQTTSSNPYQFLSKYTDTETSLIYFGRRYYDPATHRWLTPDPSGHTDGPNLYTFCHNNPLTHLDLYGLLTTSGPNSEATLGRAIESFAFHTTPSNSPWRQNLIYAGLDLQGLPHDPERVSPRPITQLVGQYPASSGVSWSSSNGLFNSNQAAVAARTTIADTYLKAPCLVFTNPTQGAINDILGAAANKIGISTSEVKLQVARITAQYNYAKKNNPYSFVAHDCHSRAVAITKLALPHLPDHIRNDLFIYAYGGPTLIPKDYAARVVNIRASNDLVARLAGPFYMSNFCFGKYNVVELRSPLGFPGADHARLGGSYERYTPTMVQEVRAEEQRRQALYGK